MASFFGLPRVGQKPAIKALVTADAELKKEKHLVLPRDVEVQDRKVSTGVQQLQLVPATVLRTHT